LSATACSLPMIDFCRSYRNFRKKARRMRVKMKHGNAILQKTGSTTGGAWICAKNNCLGSAAEEQPQQNDHRYRHAQKPE
jgi:hypothetical protein